MILDAVENLDLPNPDRHANALNSLAYLWSGLEFLDHQVKRIEKSLSASFAPGTTYAIMGNAPVLKEVPQGLVACAFHWYATSAYNYVRLAGWLGLAKTQRRQTLTWAA